MKIDNETGLLQMPDCNNQVTNTNISIAHQITLDEHKTMVDRFFNGASVNPITIPINDSRIGYGMDCKIYGIKMAFNQNDNRTNDDIDISMALFSSFSKPHKDYFVMFSIHNFKGMRDGFNVVKLELSKAFRIEDGTNVATIAIKGIDINDSAIYHGDLTNMIPLVIT